MSTANPRSHYRDTPPTAAEIVAHAERDDLECDIWRGSCHWMALLRSDQTVEVVVVRLGGDCGEQHDKAVIESVGDVIAWRPLDIMGEPVPWPEVEP